jgi:hypothetical protein
VEFIDRLERHGCRTYQKFSYKEGIEWLSNKENHAICDAVILDINCKISSNDQNVTPDSFRDYSYEVYRLCKGADKHIPWFILTAGTGGAKDLLRSIPNTPWNKMEKRYYSKASDRGDLINHIKEITSSIDEVVIREKYAGVFAIGEDEDYQQKLLSVLKILENNNYSNTSIYNDMRKLLTFIPKYGKKYGLIPDDKNTYKEAKCFLEKVNSIDPAIVPSYIVTNFHSLIDTVNNGSHHENENAEELSLNVNRDASTKAIYLSRVATFQLLTILKWLNDITINSDDEVSVKDKIDCILEDDLSTYYEGHIGLPQHDEEKDCWHIGQCCFKEREGYTLTPKTQIKLKNIRDNKDRTTKKDYKYFAHYDIVDYIS